MPPTNQNPTEIIVGYYEVYYSTSDPAFPAVNVAPGVGWTLFGKYGFRNQGKDGVILTGDIKYEEFMGQTTIVRKATRTEEAYTLKFALHDLTEETMSLAFNNNAISTVSASSGIPGSKALAIYQGPTVQYLKLLVRGLSPYSTDDNAFMQYELPRCYNTAKKELKHSKSEWAAIDFEYKVVEGPNATATNGDIGVIRAYTAAAT